MASRYRRGPGRGVVDGVAGHGSAQGLPRSRHSHEVSNTDGMRMMIRLWVGMTESASPTVQDAGSAIDAISR
jgi:hypothetical protein